MLPLPFSRGVYFVGEPLRYEKGEEMEDFRVRIENALLAATARADALAGCGGQQQDFIAKG
jgi:lysophospholipid acyltransferase (LPLAT)-like uncharacterized protein